MTNRALLHGLLVAAPLFLFASANGAVKARGPSPAVVQPAGLGVPEARALLEGGRFGEALAILRPLSRGQAADPNALFLYGLAGTGASQQPGVSEAEREALLDEAITAFRNLLIDRPELVRVRLELARAFFLKREDALARRHFEQVLAGNLPPPVVANVQRFLAAIRARKRWSVYFGAALAPDSNIGAASDERFIEIHIGGVPLPFRRDQEELTTSGVGLSLWTGRRVPAPPRRPGPAHGRGATSRGASTQAGRSSTRPISACTWVPGGSRARGRT